MSTETELDKKLEELKRWPRRSRPGAPRRQRLNVTISPLVVMALNQQLYKRSQLGINVSISYLVEQALCQVLGLPFTEQTVKPSRRRAHPRWKKAEHDRQLALALNTSSLSILGPEAK